MPVRPFHIFTRAHGRTTIEAETVNEALDLLHRTWPHSPMVPVLHIWPSEDEPAIASPRTALAGVVHQLATDSDLEDVSNPGAYRWLEAMCREALDNLPEALLVRAVVVDQGAGGAVSDLQDPDFTDVRFYPSASEAHRVAAILQNDGWANKNGEIAYSTVQVFDLVESDGGSTLVASELGTVLPRFAVVWAEEGIAREPEFFDTMQDAVDRATEIEDGDDGNSATTVRLDTCAGWPGAAPDTGADCPSCKNARIVGEGDGRRCGSCSGGKVVPGEGPFRPRTDYTAEDEDERANAQADPVDALSVPNLRAVVRKVRAALWWDYEGEGGGRWDPDLEWDTETTCVVANALGEAGLRPPDLPEAEEDPPSDPEVGETWMLDAEALALRSVRVQVMLLDGGRFRVRCLDLPGDIVLTVKRTELARSTR